MKLPNHTLTVDDAKDAVGTTNRYYGQTTVCAWVEANGRKLLCTKGMITLYLRALGEN